MDKSTITKIDRAKVSQIVFDDLKKRILVDGEYTAGDRLPSENELAKLYGVGRNSVRSALQRLSHLGHPLPDGGKHCRPAGCLG